MCNTIHTCKRFISLNLGEKSAQQLFLRNNEKNLICTIPLKLFEVQKFYTVYG